MKTDLLARTCSIFLLSTCLLAQGGGTPAPAAPAAPAAPQAPVKGDELRKAFCDADGARRTAIAAAADRVLADKAGRAQFMNTIREIAKVAPPPAPAPAKPDTAAPGTPPPPAPKPPEFADDIKKLMADAIGSDAPAQKAGLEKLAADKEKGAPALAQLDERGRAILARCVTTFIRKRLETNAIYAGQYAELRDFHPEASDLLVKWAKEAPRDVANPDQFRTGCLRALRDTLQANEATDRVRADLKEILAKAQRNRDLAFTAICALQQYGDASAFDTVKDRMQKSVEEAKDEEKSGGISQLAELYYQARKYEEAANYYKQVVGLLEKAAQLPPNMPTMVYNAACSLALAGKKDEAMQYLEKALEFSAKSETPLTKVLFDTDHDIESLRKEPKFAELYEKHFGKPKGGK